MPKLVALGWWIDELRAQHKADKAAQTPRPLSKMAIVTDIYIIFVLLRVWLSETASNLRVCTYGSWLTSRDRNEAKDKFQ